MTTVNYDVSGTALDITDSHTEDPTVLDVSNATRRLPAVILVDCSSSMINVMRELNQALEQLVNDLRGHEIAADSVELEIIEIRSTPTINQPRVEARNLVFRPMSANGGTGIGQAIELGLDRIGERQREYISAGIHAYKPMVFLLTDGQPTDAWQAAAQRVRRLGAEGKLFFFGIGTSSANFATLGQICPENMPPQKMADGKFSELFQFVSDSLSSVAGSQPGAIVPLPSTGGWAALTI